MKEIAIISGKGGTGKTIIAANIAVLAQKKVLSDCDVDASNLHLLLNNKIIERHDFYAGLIPIVDLKKCINCNRCVESCRFDAIKEVGQKINIDHISCEGCGLCALVCPVQAIKMKENHCGEWYISETKYGPLIHARLGIAEENSGKLVTLVRQNSKKVAEKNSLDLIVTDGPPGIGCPLIATLTGVNLALIVTEPTLSGIHDLERVTRAACHFGVRIIVLINKYDINIENSIKIEKWCENQNIKVVGRIHFDNIFTEALANGMPLIEYSKNSKASLEIKDVWERLKNILNE